MTSLFPFWSLGGEHRTLGLAVAVLLGIGFGFVLERAGLGRARKLMGQFYGNDLTVLKVMFTAIATAMLGAVILSGVGLLDLAAVQLRYPTFLWPMIVGGLVLGVGFVVSGYCPGTSVVAAASGKLDGLATVAGVGVGAVVYSELEAAMGSLPDSGALGSFTLPRWLGLPLPAVAAAVVIVALASFLGARKIEGLQAGRRAGETLPALGEAGPGSVAVAPMPSIPGRDMGSARS